MFNFIKSTNDDEERPIRINLIKLLLVDEDFLFLECIEKVLTNDFNDFQIVGKVAGIAGINRKVDELKPDVVITGIGSDNDLDLIESLHEQCPQVKIIVVTSLKDINTLSRLVKSGVSAYLLRNCSIKELADSILTVISGTYVLTPAMVGKLMEAFRQQSKNIQKQEFFSLSDREKEILQLAATGASNKEIAGICYISETTVKSHFRNILGKMEVRNRAGAVALATSKGLL
jgi:DNA-binding NarL/FixJ family response regulator